MLSSIQPDAQEKFMRIKHAYNSVLTSKSRGKYDAGSQGFGFSYSTGTNQSRTREAEEEFYSFGKCTCLPKLLMSMFFFKCLCLFLFVSEKKLFFDITILKTALFMRFGTLLIFCG